MEIWKKRIIASLMVLALGVSVSSYYNVTSPVYGASLQEKLEQARKDKKNAQAAQAQSKDKLKSEMAKVTALDEEAELIRAELAAIDKIIAEADAKIAEKEAEIAAYEVKIQENDAVFRERLRAMDESNTSDYIDLLLNAKSLSDFMARVETVREITEYDQGIINEMIALKNGVEASKNEIVAHRNEQQEARNLVQGKQTALDAKINEKLSYIQSLEKDLKKYDSLIQAATAQEESLKQSIAAQSSTGDASNGRIVYSGGKFCWPAPSYSYISSPYGYRIHPVYGTKKFHSGLDLAAPGGSPILAAADGTVRFAGWNGGYGNCLIIDHGNGISTLYGHARSLLVSSGARVSKGQKVALVGTTGTSTGNHLHFEVLNNGKTNDHMPYLK